MIDGYVDLRRSQEADASCFLFSPPILNIFVKWDKTAKPLCQHDIHRTSNFEHQKGPLTITGRNFASPGRIANPEVLVADDGLWRLQYDAKLVIVAR
jgi:hypothetical protein